MTTTNLLIAYCVAISVISFFGGSINKKLDLSHRQLQFALSFISGLLLGLALLHFLPEAIEELESAHDACNWMLAGLLSIFFLERFFCFHHHEDESCHSHGHSLSWGGTLAGLTVHSLLAGIALAASLLSSGQGYSLGVFLGVALHKPFEAFTISSLLASSPGKNISPTLVNGLFALTFPAGALFYFFFSDSLGGFTTGVALAFSAGVFLCIALSDLLPELHFHDHDKIQMSAFLIAGISIMLISTLMHGAH